MAPSTTLTIRIDEELKRDIEQAAQAEGRGMTDFLIRAAKVRMASQCPTCGRSDMPGSLPASFTPAFDTFLAEAKDRWPTVPVLLWTVHPAGAIVYRGLLTTENEWRDRRGFVVLRIESTNTVQDAWVSFTLPIKVPVPRGLIVGWSFDQGGEYYKFLTEQGCVDGNAVVRRQVAAHAG